MGSQILITGATGFIGRRLALDFVARGENVRILARNRQKARELFGSAVDIAAGDVCDPTSLKRACRGVKSIYHIAGVYRFGLRHRRELWRVNVEGTENLLQAASRAQVSKVVHLSSGGVLAKADVTDESPLNENDFPVSAPRFCAYKSSKWHAEKRVLVWAERGLPVSIAGTTCPIGRGDEAPTPTGRMIRDFLQRRFPFYCRTGLNFIGVGDLSRGLQSVAESGVTGRRYLLSDENLWLKNFLELLAQESGLAAPRFRLPDPLVRVIGAVGEGIDLLNPRSTSARACIETTVQAGRVQFFDNSRTREELGWQPLCSIRENVAEAVAWFRGETEIDLASADLPMETHVR